MNQRIKELAYQADLVIKKSNGNDFRFGAMDPKLEKFALLIVRECAGICDDYGMPDGTSPTAIILSAAIKKRFGIKE